MRNVLEMVQDRLMFLLSSSAVLGTYSFPPPFLRPLFGMNSLTHSPLTAAISLKQERNQGQYVEGHGVLI